MFRLLTVLLLFAIATLAGADTALNGREFIDRQIAAHPGSTGTLVLDKGQDSLLARAWLADHATHSIEVQYFIWSSDNIGILASEALLRAAKRGVRVRVGVSGTRAFNHVGRGDSRSQARVSDFC